MNCLQSSQLLLSGSIDNNPEHVHHLESCDSCKRLSSGILRNDSMLAPAFAVNIPEGLADDIIKECFKAEEKRALFPVKTIFLVTASIAASIVMFIISASLINRPPAPNGSDLVLTHVIDELGVLDIKGDLGDDRLRWELKDYGLSLQHSIGQIRWIGRCELPGGLGLHVVADNETFGIISIIVPPLPSKKVEKVEENGITAWMINIDSIQVGLASNKSTQTSHISRYIESAIAEASKREEVSKKPHLKKMLVSRTW